VAFLAQDDLKQAYSEADSEAKIWKKDYPAYERLADNGLMEMLDENLPEVNDGSLAAALFKLPKRIVSSNLRGSVTVADRNEQWMAKLANFHWQKEIIPYANQQAPFHRKWKDAVRKSAIYGGVPLITLFVENDGRNVADFIVAAPGDVRLEAGKVSDMDSRVMFWDVYYTKQQVEEFLEQAEAADKDAKAAGGGDNKDGDADSYDKWFAKELRAIIKANDVQTKPSIDSSREANKKGVHKTGFHFTIIFQRGVNAPFYMYHPTTNKVVREWSNPDPTGDMPIHYLYCYQDFNNPYGTGIVKLAGGTQNVLDYMRQADVLATQIGLRPPIAIEGEEADVDIDSIVYAQDAIWFTGGAKVVRQELADGVYSELPNRIAMYKISLNSMIPTGDTSIGSNAGDAQYSKTPKGVQFQADNLSIDDEDYRDNLYMCFAAVAKSMINTHFANMEGTDLMRLSDDERQDLINAGLQFPANEAGEMSNEVEMVWDNLRARFDFEVDPSSGVKTNDAETVQHLKDLLATVTPQVSYYLAQDGYKFNLGEAYRSLLNKSGIDNIDDIITKMTDEEAAEAKKQPFPIIDPPQIRLTGQIPTGAMPAALSTGGVSVPPNTPLGDDSVDLGDVLKDPATTANEKAQIKALAGIQPDPVAPGTPGTPEPASTGPTPDEVALKHRELDIKQQDTNQRAVKLRMDAEKQKHQTAMDIIREAAPPAPATTAPATKKPKAKAAA
jgi:hypothetical protein